ncbi:MAG: methyltransferase domain-containing protein [Treponema sp.]|jgi:tRNA G10  N-methylase Trm11|nr:methyltransferase domain-containing protein [Treponema sp.]
MKYYATFVSGMQELVSQIVYSRLADAHITALLDGAVIFETSCPYSNLNFFCFNNIFSVIDYIKTAPDQKSIELHIKKIVSLAKGLEFDPNINRITSFRVITSYENQLVHIQEDLKKAVEKVIAKRMHLNVNRSNPDTEYWFLVRSEGFSIFMKRLTRRSREKVPRKGELAPELAYMMCRLSEPDKNDVVMDPFCGYGAIPYQRLKRFPLRRFYMFDRDNKVLAIAKQTVHAKGSRLCLVQRIDAYDLPSLLPDQSIDKIITDPPWGLYEPLPCEAEQFYRDILGIFTRLLKPKGLIILLTAREEELCNALTDIPLLQVTKRIAILVSGKKAGIFCILKTDSYSGFSLNR